MFEDQQKAAVGAPPSNLPAEPVDMFAGVEEKQPQAPGQRPFQPPDAMAAGLLKKKENELNIKTPPVLPGEFEEGETSVYKMKGPMVGKVILMVFVLAALALGGWWFIKKPSLPIIVPETVIPTNTEEQAPAPAPAATSTEASTATPSQNANDAILFGESTDTDSDGLDDSRERDLGTDPAISDSDSDGLSDGDEVIIWKTNPLNPDTDGDSHVDGKEVRNLYNPLGPGKLFAPTSATSTL